MEEWKEYKAIEFCMTVTDGTHDSPKPKAEGYYLITSKHLKDTGIDFSSANFISEEDYLKVIARSKVEQYDILYSMIGTIGNIVQVKVEHVDFAVKNMGIFKMGKNYLRSSWLFYWLKSPYSYEYVAQRLAGSTQSYLTLNSLREFPVLYPGDNIAGKIVSILKSLDDKIEVNRRINDNLEQQAQALFKSWFVDFEPFKHGEFVESELGMIPKGWRVKQLGKLMETTSGGTPSRKNTSYYNNGTINWVKSKELHDRFIIDTEETITDDAIKESSAKILPLHSVLVAMYGATVGEIGINAKPMACNQAVCAILPNRLFPFSFIYMFVLFNKISLINKAIGSAQQNISQVIIKGMKLAYDIDVISKFNDIIESMLIRIEKNMIESSRLSSLRDTLLPRLMSGELKINDISV